MMVSPADRREGRQMADPTAEFFEGLERRAHDPLLQRVSGTMRFDVVDGKRTARWFVTVKKGQAKVSRQGSRSDCVVKADKRLLSGIVSGKVNAFAATLRGELEVEGDPELMVLFQRLLPGPAGSRS
jgi:predicted lipid carrier protein YhbT